jgi:hypothetical protein
LARRQICAILFCMLSMSLACAAPEASPRYELSIRAGLALDEALQELAHQTGIQVVFFSKITAGRSAPALSGEYTLTAALTRLLKGSDLTFRQVNEHTVEVRQAPPHSARLPPKSAAADADARFRRSPQFHGPDRREVLTARMRNGGTATTRASPRRKLRTAAFGIARRLST